MRAEDVLDANLLLYAHNSLDANHQQARTWWEDCLNGTTGIALAWVVILDFVRISTHPRIYLAPYTPEEALDRVGEWLTLPHIQVLPPSANHFELWSRLLADLGTAGNLTTDAHLAALAIERGLILHTTDADFARFSGLKWVNPLRTS